MSRTTAARRTGRALVAASLSGALALSALAVAPAAHAAVPTSSAAVYGSEAPEWEGVYRQSLAILGIRAGGHTPAKSAVQWLLDQRCSNGAFSDFNPSPNPSKPCPAYDTNSYTGGINTNAIALASQALLSVGRTTEGMTAANRLRELQNSGDKGWEMVAGSGWGSDPNSTGLALTALNAAGLEPLYDPQPFLDTLQFGRGQDAADDSEVGAFAVYDGGAPNAYATMQVVPAVGGFDLVAPTTPEPWTTGLPDLSPSLPSATGMANHGSAWLAAQVDADQLGTDELAWTVLSFATTASSRTQAGIAYERLRGRTLDLAGSLHPASSFAQAAIAAKVLGEDEDAANFAGLIERTLTTAPVADYALSTTSVWSTRTVTLERTSVSSDQPVSAQTVVWGDGTTTTVSGSAQTVTHKYTSASKSTYKVSVVVRDSLANASTVPVGAVTVTKDKVAPRIWVTRPSDPEKIGNWKTVKGTSSDTGVGVAKVTVRLTQKRVNGSWYAYTGSKWVKKSSLKKADKAAKRIALTPKASGSWKLAVKGLTKGGLRVTVSATDKAGNSSKSVTSVAPLLRK